MQIIIVFQYQILGQYWNQEYQVGQVMKTYLIDMPISAIQVCERFSQML